MNEYNPLFWEPFGITMRGLTLLLTLVGNHEAPDRTMNGPGGQLGQRVFPVITLRATLALNDILTRKVGSSVLLASPAPP